MMESNVEGPLCADLLTRRNDRGTKARATLQNQVANVWFFRTNAATNPTQRKPTTWMSM